MAFDLDEQLNNYSAQTENSNTSSGFDLDVALQQDSQPIQNEPVSNNVVPKQVVPQQQGKVQKTVFSPSQALVNMANSTPMQATTDHINKWYTGERTNNVLSNLARDGAEVVNGLAQLVGMGALGAGRAIAHPIQTAKNAGKFVTDTQDLANSAIPNLLNGNSDNVKAAYNEYSQNHPVTQLVPAMVEGILEQYGQQDGLNPGAFAQSFVKHPLLNALDVIGVGEVGKVPKIAKAINAGTAAKNIEKGYAEKAIKQAKIDKEVNKLKANGQTVPSDIADQFERITHYDKETGKKYRYDINGNKQYFDDPSNNLVLRPIDMLLQSEPVQKVIDNPAFSGLQNAHATFFGTKSNSPYLGKEASAKAKLREIQKQTNGKTNDEIIDAINANEEQFGHLTEEEGKDIIRKAEYQEPENLPIDNKVDGQKNVTSDEASYRGVVDDTNIPNTKDVVSDENSIRGTVEQTGNVAAKTINKTASNGVVEINGKYYWDNSVGEMPSEYVGNGNGTIIDGKTYMEIGDAPKPTNDVQPTKKEFYNGNEQINNTIALPTTKQEPLLLEDKQKQVVKEPETVANEVTDIEPSVPESAATRTVDDVKNDINALNQEMRNFRKEGHTKEELNNKFNEYNTQYKALQNELRDIRTTNKASKKYNFDETEQVETKPKRQNIQNKSFDSKLMEEHKQQLADGKNYMFISPDYVDEVHEIQLKYNLPFDEAARYLDDYIGNSNAWEHFEGGKDFAHYNLTLDDFINSKLKEEHKQQLANRRKYMFITPDDVDEVYEIQSKYNLSFDEAARYLDDYIKDGNAWEYFEGDKEFAHYDLTLDDFIHGKLMEKHKQQNNVDAFAEEKNVDNKYKIKDNLQHLPDDNNLKPFVENNFGDNETTFSDNIRSDRLPEENLPQTDEQVLDRIFNNPSDALKAKLKENSDYYKSKGKLDNETESKTIIDTFAAYQNGITDRSKITDEMREKAVKTIAELPEDKKPFYVPRVYNERLTTSDFNLIKKMKSGRSLDDVDELKHRSYVGKADTIKGGKLNRSFNIKDIVNKIDVQRIRLKNMEKFIDSVTESFAKPLKDLDSIEPGYVAYNPDAIKNVFFGNIDMGELFTNSLRENNSIEAALKNALVSNRIEINDEIAKAIQYLTNSTPQYQIPKAIYDDLTKMNDADKMFGKKKTNTLLSLWDIGNDSFKKNVLGLNAKWFINNRIGNTIMAALKGHNLLNPQHFLTLNKIENKYFPSRISGETFHASENIMQQRATGNKGLDNVFSLLNGTSVESGNAFGKALLNTAALPGKVVNSIVKKVFDINQKFETMDRKTVYMKAARKEAIKKTGRNLMTDREILEYVKNDPEMVEKCLEHVDNVLGDYATMTPFERSVVKRVMPFYSWMRTISRHTASLPKDSPLRASLTNRLAVMTNEENEDLPNYQEGSVETDYVRDNDNKDTVLNYKHSVPYSTFAETGENPISLFVPEVNRAIEAITGRKTYNGMPLTSKRYDTPYTGGYVDLEDETGEVIDLPAKERLKSFLIGSLRDRVTGLKQTERVLGGILNSEDHLPYDALWDTDFGGYMNKDIRKNGEGWSPKEQLARYVLPLQTKGHKTYNKNTYRQKQHNKDY